VSLRILFADDSVTAQNMGRKILTEAGYDVVAVSNGAAAVKKIAEQKPDIIILDVYMPGYSGLEVCEKVRGSLETVKTPVLLTVGKMEPYKAEDGNRVKADGVIVKPFEASDLLAIMKKFEERIGQTPVLVPQPVLVERFQEEISEPPMELPAEHATISSTPQPMVEVPDHMATTSAFSDLLGTEPSVSVNHFEPPPPLVAEAAPAIPVTVHTTIPDYELPASWRDQIETDQEIPAPAAIEARAAIEPAPAQTAIEPVPQPEPVLAAPEIAVRPLQIPVYQEPEAGDGYAFLPTSTSAPAEIEIPREPELLETAAEATRNTLAEETEPGLLSTGQQFTSTPADAMAAELAPVEESFAPAGFQDIPADIVSHLPPPAVEAVPESGPAAPSEKPADEPYSDADFESRVAAALAAYSRAQEAPPALSQAPVSEFAPAPADVEAPAIADAGPSTESTEAYVHQAAPAEPPVEAIEYQPTINATAELPPVESQPVDAAPVAPTTTLPEDMLVSAPEPPSPSVEYHHEYHPEYRPPVSEYPPQYHPPVSEMPEAPVREMVTSDAVEVAAPATQMEPGPMAAEETPAVVAPPIVAQALHAAVEAPHTLEPAPSAPAVVEATAASADPSSLTAGLEAALPEKAAAAAAAGADHHTISQAVHRVMERLKPELVEEILRELKSKKE
jgi:CheY-like chemotaxis protein